MCYKSEQHDDTMNKIKLEYICKNTAVSARKTIVTDL